MKKLILMYLLIPIMVYSQNEEIINKLEPGIEWTTNLNWKQVLIKAKAENKNIFLDCYTTWCGPCKFMEKEVYSVDAVKKYYSDKFICVKVQMDQTNNDGELIKSHYQDAKFIESQFKVNVYPTFIFFSPNGELLHRYAGALNVEGFLDLGISALDPKKQYYNMLSQYKMGKLDTAMMKKIAQSSRYFGEKALSEKIAADYISSLNMTDLKEEDDLKFIRDFKNLKVSQEKATIYISRLKKREILKNKQNALFLSDFISSTKDLGFKLYLKYPSKINQMVGIEGFAERLVTNIIVKERINPIIFTRDSLNSLNPDWNRILIKLKSEIGENIANRATSDAKVRWYSAKKDWPEYTKNLVSYVKKYGSDMSNFTLNNMAWEVFQKSKDSTELRAALSWMTKVLNADPYWAAALDTYANILYKLNNVKDALVWEERASKLDPLENDIKENLNKMRMGTPTWAKR